MWCDEESYAGILVRSLEGFERAGHAMPPPRALPGVERLSAQLDEQALFERFMREFGGSSREAFVDVMGNALTIDRSLFENLKGGWKIQKGERAQWLLYTAANIKTPDEIWHEPSRHGGPDKLYYLSRFEVGRRELLACVSVFDREPDVRGVWTGRTNYATTQLGYAERKRNEEIVSGEIKYWRWE